ncbi:hypothetical protein AXF42_Ash016059 [Apostasia shenzhenica]|uniref:Uncharacterized protein n=1 Tax=Apostasia shenzhenica TaxID=1088818 RepID=A0A2I0B392_9ASPA|nr:hypothetical protein AXF42_Ash016059 [Apostasia shenzhenica]
MLRLRAAVYERQARNIRRKPRHGGHRPVLPAGEQQVDSRLLLHRRPPHAEVEREHLRGPWHCFGGIRRRLQERKVDVSPHRGIRRGAAELRATVAQSVELQHSSEEGDHHPIDSDPADPDKVLAGSLDGVLEEWGEGEGKGGCRSSEGDGTGGGKGGGEAEGELGFEGEGGKGQLSGKGKRGA